MIEEAVTDERLLLDARTAPVLDEADYSDVARASGTAEATIRKRISRRTATVSCGPGPRTASSRRCVPWT
jgi:hypothetical protein